MAASSASAAAMAMFRTRYVNTAADPPIEMGRADGDDGSLDALRHRAVEPARLDDESEHLDVVRVGGGNGDVGPLDEGRRDGDGEVRGFEVGGRATDLLLRRGGRRREPAGDGALACAGPDGVGQRDVVVEDDAELDDGQEEE